MKLRNAAIFIVFILILANIPYVLGYIQSDSDYGFSGFVINPTDGNSYLAKMQQGFNGSWRFYLPFTSDAPQSSILFLFYLFLGHVSRWTGFSLILVFHLARLLSAALLLFSLWRLSSFFSIDRETSKQAFILSSIGSGVGWILLPWSIMTADYWISEAYPFLSAYANPHFALGLCILLWLLLLYVNKPGLTNSLFLCLLSATLALILPFGIAIFTIIILGDTFRCIFLKKRFSLSNSIFALFPGGVIVLVQYYQTLNDSYLSHWNVQNITTSPALWDLLISLSPALIFAILAIILMFKCKDEENHLTILLVGWLLAAIFLTYFPINLQRRFLMGIYIPVAFLGAAGINKINIPAKHKNKIWKIVLLFSIITNIFTILGGIFNVLGVNPKLFLTGDEVAGLKWISQNTQLQDVVLASPEMGNIIPARTGRRVIYGHPFETVYSNQKLSDVKRFYSAGFSKVQVHEFLDSAHVDYIYWGPREKSIPGFPPDLSELRIVYKNSSVIIFAYSVK